MIEKCRERAAELAIDLNEAKTTGDNREQTKIWKELQAIQKEIGQGGSKQFQRKLPRTTQMDRVRKNIDNVLLELEDKQHGLPALAAHLRESLDPSAGTYTYKPHNPYPNWTIRI